jgi:hypothetical protein
MLHLVKAGLRTLASAFKARRDLALENLALHQQLAVVEAQEEKETPKAITARSYLLGNSVQDLQELEEHPRLGNWIV